MTAGEKNPMAFSYGYDRLRFIKPVFIGDTIRSRVTIKEKRDHKKPGTASWWKRWRCSISAAKPCWLASIRCW